MAIIKIHNPPVVAMYFKPRLTKKHRWTLPLVFVLGLVSASSNLTAAVKITDLGTLGGEFSFAYAINNLDQVVGRSWMQSGPCHSFLYENGLMTDLYPLNSQDVGTLGPTGINNSGQVVSGAMAGSVYYPALYDYQSRSLTILGSLGGVTNDGFNGVATAINDFTQVVGYSYVDDFWAHAFFYDKGIMQDLGCVPDANGACFSYAFDVNDRGQAVGGGSGGAFLYTNGVMTNITPFGSPQSYAFAINNLGQVVGYYYGTGAFHAFRYNDGKFTILKAPDSPETVPYGINDRGQVVGYTLVRRTDSCRDCDDYVVHAFIDENGVLTDLNTLLPSNSPWELIEAYGINNKGKIVGYGEIHGQRHAFLLELIPSAQTLRGGR